MPKVNGLSLWRRLIRIQLDSQTLGMELFKRNLTSRAHPAKPELSKTCNNTVLAGHSLREISAATSYCFQRTRLA